MIFFFCFFVVSSLACQTKLNSYSIDTTIIQKETPDYRNLSYGVFNNIYRSIYHEEDLNLQRICFGDCSAFNPTERPNTTRRYQNYLKNCFGTIHACKRITPEDWPFGCQACVCLCERNDPKVKIDNSELLDSFCMDPISVDRGFVAIGVRFKKHQNKIHLEFLQGKLKDGKIINESISWKQTNFCENQKKVIYNFKGWTYDGIKIVLEDIILPNDAAITGATFTQSLQGKYLDSDGNIDISYPEFDYQTQCPDNTIDLVHVAPKLLPPTAINGTITELSESCKHHVLFAGTTWDSAYTSQIVPFVDLQEVITTPFHPISGLGLVYRGQPGYGGYLALKIFVRKKIREKYLDGYLFANERLVPYL